MRGTKTWNVATAVVVAIVLARVGWMGASAQDQGAFKLEGAWIARVTSFNGNPWSALTQWSYVIAANASGRKGTIHGSIDVPFPIANPATAADYSTPITGEVVQTGPDTLADKSIWYAIRKTYPVHQILNIGTATSEGKWLGPDKIEWTVHFAIYLPSADTDGDGIPEADSVPIASFTVTTLDTRLPFQP